MRGGEQFMMTWNGTILAADTGISDFQRQQCDYVFFCEC